MALTKPGIVDDPLEARRPSPAAPSTREAAFSATAPAPSAPRHDQPGNQGGDPYDGSPKVAVNMRATKELWDHLGVLSRRLEDAGVRTSRTELTEALWHFHSPQNPDDARELVMRYRRARLG
jgi:hypothetical protein